MSRQFGEWSISAAAQDTNTTFAETPMVPLGSLTGEGVADEMRAWHPGYRHVGTTVFRRSPCQAPASTAIDGFRASVVREKAVFTLHFRAALQKVDSFEGAQVAEQVALVRIPTDLGDRSSFIGVEFDLARKIVIYVDARTSPARQLASIKIDILGQNVLRKTSWRFGDPSIPFNADETLGTISARAFVRGSSDVATSAGGV